MLVWVSVSKRSHRQRAKTVKHAYSRGDEHRRIASPAVDQHTFAREYSWFSSQSLHLYFLLSRGTFGTALSFILFQFRQAPVVVSRPDPCISTFGDAIFTTAIKALFNINFVWSSSFARAVRSPFYPSACGSEFSFSPLLALLFCSGCLGGRPMIVLD